MVPPDTITARLRGSRDRLILRSFWFGHASPWGKETNRWWGSVQRLVCIGFSRSCFDGFKTWKRRPLAWYEHKNDHSGHSSEECPTSPEKNRCVLFPHFSKDFLWLLYVFACGCECWEWKSSWPSANREWILNYVLHVFEIPFEPWVSRRRCKISPVLHWLGDLVQTPAAPWWKDFRHSVSVPQSRIQSPLEIKHLELKKGLGLHVYQINMIVHLGNNNFKTRLEGIFWSIPYDHFDWC